MAVALVGLELGQQRLDPSARDRLVLRMRRVGHGPQVLADVVEVEVHAPPDSEEAIISQIPDPHRAIGHDEDFASPAKPSSFADWTLTASVPSAHNALEAGLRLDGGEWGSLVQPALRLKS